MWMFKSRRGTGSRTGPESGTGRGAGTGAGDTNEDPQSRNNLIVTVRGLVWWVGISGTIVALAGIGPGLDADSIPNAVKEFLTFFTRAALIAAAAFSVGGLLGFLFGIPRTLQQESPPPVSASSTGVAAAPGNWSGYRQNVNTNLEQISDWLTKILVGVGLTQLTEMPKLIWQLAESLPVGGNTPFSVALILNFLICGFFSGYLLTRLFLAGAFYKAESELGKQTERADILKQVGAYDKAASEYEKALQAITQSTPREQKRSIYEGLIYTALYQPPPEGFQRAIQYAQEYIAEEPDFPSARIWAYLAAAYGQQYKYEKEGEKGPDVLEPIKQKALEATKKALAIDPQVKRLIRMMWDPNDPAKSPDDDDLEVFYAMPEFKNLLDA